MIEKITIKYPDFDDLKDKINELVDAVNEIMTWRFETDEDSDWYDGDHIADVSKKVDIGELAYLQKENSDLKDKVEKLQDTIDYLEGSLWYIFNNAPDLEKARQEANISLKRIEQH